MSISSFADRQQGEKNGADHGVPLVMCGSGRRGVDFSPAMLPAGAGSMGAILAI
jgi:hypothetical protein